MIHVPSASERIVILGDFVGFTPHELFDYWTDPVRLVQWWPKTAEVDGRVGGAYRFEWPQPGYLLHGVYTAFEPGKHLGFTWSWSHEHAQQPLQVDIYFEPLLE